MKNRGFGTEKGENSCSAIIGNWLKQKVMNGIQEGKNLCRKLNTVFRGETDRSRQAWMKQKCNKIGELTGTRRYDLMYKEPGLVGFGRKARKFVWWLEMKSDNLISDRHEILHR